MTGTARSPVELAHPEQVELDQLALLLVEADFDVQSSVESSGAWQTTLARWSECMATRAYAVPDLNSARDLASADGIGEGESRSIAVATAECANEVNYKEELFTLLRLATERWSEENSSLVASAVSLREHREER